MWQEQSKEAQNISETGLEKQVNKMLSSDPVGASAASLAIWRRIKPLTVAQLKQFWHKFSSQDMLDDGLEYREWQEGNQKCFGTVNRISGKQHGIVRKVQLNGQIFELTYKDGWQHGMERKVANDKVYIEAYKEGEHRAKLAFNTNFKRTFIRDPDHLLDDVTPGDFIH